ncbi:hypothetical protein JMJ78_0004623 [Colletotrichum scovillei]|nr:hypothetical protein JMJ78_0004623 [Colletotrichum scovillei]
MLAQLSGSSPIIPQDVGGLSLSVQPLGDAWAIYEISVTKDDGNIQLHPLLNSDLTNFATPRRFNHKYQMLQKIIAEPPLRLLTPTARRVSAASGRTNALKFSTRLSTASPHTATSKTTARKDTIETTSPVDANAQSRNRKKTIAEQDEELRLKLEGISGDGGASGVEYESGKAEGLKRGVKENMFRVI